MLGVGLDDWECLVVGGTRIVGLGGELRNTGCENALLSRIGESWPVMSERLEIEK